MTGYDFGDVILVPFPFTDQTGAKKRPAAVVSSAAYNIARLDLILMAITSQTQRAVSFGEVEVTEWRKANLIKPSVIKPVMATIEKRLVLRRLGALEAVDRLALQTALRSVIG